MKKKKLNFLFLFLFCCFLITGCEAKETPTVVTIGKKEVKMDELLYYISYYESVGETERNQIAQTTGIRPDYWNEEYKDQKTAAEYFKQELYNTVVMNQIYADLAAQRKETLSEEEKKLVKEKAEQIYGEHSDEVIKTAKLTKEGFETALTTIALSKKYTDLQLTEIEASLDKKELLSDIFPKDYRQFKTECVYLRTKTLNQEKELEEPSEEKLASMLEEFSRAYILIKNNTKLDEVKEMFPSLPVDARTVYFSKGQSDVEPAYQEAAIGLKNGQVTNLVEGEYGYYIIKMVDNNNMEYYEETRRSILDTEKQRLLLEQYESLKQSYTITLNKEVWESIVLGTITLGGITTPPLS